jgi:hypothetical protein
MIRKNPLVVGSLHIKRSKQKVISTGAHAKACDRHTKGPNAMPYSVHAGCAFVAFKKVEKLPRQKPKVLAMMPCLSFLTRVKDEEASTKKSL